MASTLKVDNLEGSTASTVTVPTGQSLVVTDGIGIASIPTITVAKGGTNTTSYTTGDTVYASGATAISKLGIGTARQGLQTNSGASAPEWVDSPQSLMTAAGDVLYASGANTLAKLAKGSDDEVLTLASGVPSWAAAGGGLSEADSWRLTTPFTGDQEPINANLERSDTAAQGQGHLGTGMTESSGIFTFPSTGWWSITFSVVNSITSGAHADYVTAMIATTIDDSSYAASAYGGSFDQSDGGVTYSNGYASCLFDVTDVANCKVRFEIDTENTSVYTYGSTSIDTTSMKFTKLADT